MLEFRLPSLVTRIFGEGFLAYVWSVNCLVAAVGYARFGHVGTAALLAAAGLCLALLTTRSVTVGVGAEGVRIRWIGLAWFVRYDEIVDVEPHEARESTRLGFTRRKSSGILLRRKRGFDLYLVCEDATSRDLRAAALQQKSTFDRGRPMVVPELRRGGRDLRGWMGDLRALLSHEGYRAQSRAPEALWGVLENPKNEVDERAAAALALRAHFGNVVRPRLRIAADACAEPQLRVAREAIDAGDETTTEAHLATLTSRTRTHGEKP